VLPQPVPSPALRMTVSFALLLSSSKYTFYLSSIPLGLT
jgi:hypothetical protein